MDEKRPMQGSVLPGRPSVGSHSGVARGGAVRGSARRRSSDPLPALSEGQARLAARHINLASTIARQAARKVEVCWGNSALRQELRSEAFVGLCLAAASFDPLRGMPFPAHARPRIQGQIRDYLRSIIPVGARWAWRSGRCDLPRAVPLELQHVAIEPRGVQDVERASRVVDLLLALLPGRERALIGAVLGAGGPGSISHAELAAVLGCSRKHSARLMAQAVARMRAGVEEIGVSYGADGPGVQR